MKIAILGAGHGGYTMAADLSLAGHEVNLYELPQYEQNLDGVRQRGGIELTGTGRDGFAKIAAATTDIKEAIQGTQLIMVVTPAFVHMTFIEKFAPNLEDGQVIVFNTGNFASFVCANHLKKKKIKAEVTIAETECLIYACRIMGPGKAWAMAVKDKLRLAALPATRTKRALDVATKAFPQFYAGKNVLETSVTNINFAIHPVSTIMNTGKIEQLGAYQTTHYDTTPSIARVMEAVDAERSILAKKLGLGPVSTKDTLLRYYGAKGSNLYEALVDSRAYKVQTSPANLQSRYITEDIPYGLVPIASLGEMLRIQMPTTDAIIDLCSAANATDYRREGLTVEKLGLKGLTAKQIIKRVNG